METQAPNAKQYDVYEARCNGVPCWCVKANAGPSRVGDTIWPTLDLAEEYAHQERSRVEGRAAAALAKAEADAALAAEYNDCDGFTDGMSRLQAGRALAALHRTRAIRSRDGIDLRGTRRDVVRRLVAMGGRSGTREGKAALIHPDGRSYWIVTATEADYARHLSARGE